MMNQIKMWALREDSSSEPLSIRTKYMDAKADASKLGLTSFEIVQVWITVVEISVEEILRPGPAETKA